MLLAFMCKFLVLALATAFGCSTSPIPVVPTVGPLANLSFGAAAMTALGKSPNNLLIVELDGDGRLDVVVTNENDQAIGVLLGTGRGTFQPQTAYSTGMDAAGLVAGDWNKDGHLDLAISEFGSGTGDSQLAVFLATGGGALGARTEYAAGDGAAWSLTGDFDGDGTPDLATENINARTFSVFHGAGNGTFAHLGDYAAGGDVRGCAAGDFDGNGIADIVGTALDGTLLIMLGGKAGLAAGKVYPGAIFGSSEGSVAVVDLDGDGKLDIVGPGVVTLLGLGDGTFAPPHTFPVAGASGAIAIADFNLDGHPDVAVLQSSTAKITILLGNGDGSLRLGATANATMKSAALGAGDFDGDGKPDLVVTDAAADSGTLLLLLNTSN